MALITPFRGEGDRAGDLLAIADRHFQDAAQAFEDLIAGIGTGGKASKTEAKAVARDYRAALQTLFDERNRIEQLKKKEAGVVHDYALDIRAARDEIGRKLDRLRAARSPS